MNRYLLFTRSGKAFAVSANYSHDAVAKVETFSREVVSCWFLGERMRAYVAKLETLPEDEVQTQLKMIGMDDLCTMNGFASRRLRELIQREMRNTDG